VERVTWLVSELTQRKLNIQIRSIGAHMEELRPMENEVPDPTRVWMMLGDLVIHKQSLMQQLQEIQQKVTRNPRFYERWIVRVFEWSIKDRFGGMVGGIDE